MVAAASGIGCDDFNTTVYYLAPSIVGVVIVVVLSSMWKTEARCFFMVTVPFYYLTNLCASADVCVWTSFLSYAICPHGYHYQLSRCFRALISYFVVVLF